MTKIVKLLFYCINYQPLLSLRADVKGGDAVWF